MRALLLATVLAAAPHAQTADALVGAWAVARYDAPDVASGAADPLGRLLPDLSVPEAPVTITLAPDGAAEILVVVAQAVGFLVTSVIGSWQATDGRLVLTLDDLDDALPATEVAFTIRAEGDGWVLAGDAGIFRVVPDPLAAGAVGAPVTVGAPAQDD